MHELSNIYKGSSSITEYFDCIRMLSDELSLIQQPLANRDLSPIVLDGLNLDYDVISNYDQTIYAPPSF